MKEDRIYFETNSEKDEFIDKLDQLLNLTQCVIYQDISKKEEARARKRLERLKKKLQEGKENEL